MRGSRWSWQAAPPSRAQQLALAPRREGADERRAWAAALEARWAPASRRAYLGALRTYRAF
eukprot:gene21947-19504_t